MTARRFSAFFIMPSRLMDTINRQQQELISTFSEINGEFTKLNASVEQMEAGNNANAEESTGISGDVSEVSAFCQALGDSLTGSSKKTAGSSNDSKIKIEDAISKLLLLPVNGIHQPGNFFLLFLRQILYVMNAVWNLYDSPIFSLKAFTR